MSASWLWSETTPGCAGSTRLAYACLSPPGPRAEPPRAGWSNSPTTGSIHAPSSHCSVPAQPLLGLIGHRQGQIRSEPIREVYPVAPSEPQPRIGEQGQPQPQTTMPQTISSPSTLPSLDQPKRSPSGPALRRVRARVDLDSDRKRRLAPCSDRNHSVAYTLPLRSTPNITNERQDSMASGNTVELVGNLARDPELRFTPSGQALASFGLAVNRRWQNRQTQEWEEAVSFIDVTVWGQQAENVAQSLAKGSRVMVSGRFEQQSWEDKAGGGKRSKVVVIADEVAPSLRWATAAITRIERTDTNGGGNATPARPGANSKPVANEPPGDYQYEEEPF